MEKKYLITINPKPNSKKPVNHEKRLHYKGLSTRTGVTINEFSTMVSAPNSFTWYGGTYNDKLVNENVEAINLLAFDFDEGNSTPEEKISILKGYGIEPNLWYSTFSSTIEKPKFRIVLFLEDPITDIKDHTLIYKAFLNILKDADSSCQNPSRHFYGGIESHILDHNPISVTTLVDNLNIALISSDGGRSRKIFSLNNRYSGNNGTFLLEYNRNDQFLPEIKNNKKHTTIKGGVKIDWEIARKKVKILDKFLSGEWLYHNQLFPLATNMLQVRGGQSLFKETMEKFNKTGKTQYTQNNFNIITYLKIKQYPPIPIYSFSPYEEDSSLHDLVGEVLEKRGKIELVNPIVTISLEEAEQKFRSDFEEILSRKNDAGIYLIKVPPGIGKTELLTNVTATLAFPTHVLKNEVAQRMKIPFIVSPDAINFSDKNLNNKLHFFYSKGEFQNAMSLIHSVAKNENSWYTHEDEVQASKYITLLEISKNTNESVLTTHARAMILSHSHDTIIFDEDFLETLLPIKKISLSDLIKIQSNCDKDSDEIGEYVDIFRLAKPGVPNKSPNLEKGIDTFFESLSTTSTSGNIIDLLFSHYFVKDTKDLDTIYFIKQNFLPVNKKIIVMSATAPEKIYSKIFGDKLNIIKMDEVEPKGKIIQHTSRSCSRSELNRYHNIISQKVGDQPVITFKGFDNYFSNPVENMYFGNTSGYDDLKGKNISVVGTPHRNNVFYHLVFAHIYGIEENLNTSMKYQKIEYNGFRFKFNCFDDELLREIQFSVIEGDLIQACGRARVLRTDATVNLYSNFPLRSSFNFVF